MDWEKLFLETLRASQPDWDAAPDWRAALALYEGLSTAEAAALDRQILKTIDDEYRNPHSSREQLPFDDVMVNLPAGMVPDDLLCIEAAVLVAAERHLGEALFAFNRLMRSPRWHPLSARLYWLNQEGFAAQRHLMQTEAGRCLGAMVGLACGDGLGVTLTSLSRTEIRRRFPEGHREMAGGGSAGLAPGEWSAATATVLAAAGEIVAGQAAPADAIDGGALLRALPAALADTPPPGPDPAVAVYQHLIGRLAAGVEKATAFEQSVHAAAGPLAERLARVPGLTEDQVQATGNLVDTLEAALWAFLSTDSPEACLLRAVHLGGHASLTGAVAGGLAGACYGAGAIPRRWTAALKHRLQLEETAERLFLLARRS